MPEAVKRVYGLLVTGEKVLVSTEQHGGRTVVKFTGGRVEAGETETTALQREWQEECGCRINILSRLYETDFAIISAFTGEDVCCAYYLVSLQPGQLPVAREVAIDLSWQPIENLDKIMTFESEQHAARALQQATLNRQRGDDVQAADHECIWHPYTQMLTAPQAVAVERGDGVYLYGYDGNKLLDAVSSWWVSIHGHANKHIAEAVGKQAAKLEQVIFAGFTHEPAVKLATRLLSILPGQQRRVFYSDNGSTAVEVALKMCLQYWSNAGAARQKIVAFENAYHGDTFGAMAVSGRSVFTRAFDGLLFDVVFLPLPDDDNVAEVCGLASMHADAAAFIYEPLVLGSGGMLMYEAALLDQVLQVFRSNGVLLIADEVMTGFGRTGTLFACEQLAVKPDIYCLSKGLTGGTMPMGVTTCVNAIYEAFLSNDKSHTLYHGHSFTANPIACAASNASLDLVTDPCYMNNIRRITASHKTAMPDFARHKNCAAVRCCGVILAVEFKAGGYSYTSNLRDRLYTYFMNHGVLLRPLGNLIYLMPPAIISNEELERCYLLILNALNDLYADGHTTA